MSAEVRVSKSELLESIRTDCLTVLSFYLGDELDLEVPEFHVAIWNQFLEKLLWVRDPTHLVGMAKKLFCVPRGHSKSTLAKLCVILFLRYSPFRFVMYVSNTIALGIQAIKDILSWFESVQEAALYGPLIKGWKEKANESQGLWILHINTPDYGVKRVILKAAGSDTRIRGALIDNQRPEFLIADDCEDLDTCNTEQTQARFDRWFIGTLLKAMAKKSCVIMLGNMLSDKTLLYRYSKLPAWNPTVYGAIVREKKTGKLVPLWPGMWTIERLIDNYKEDRSVSNGLTWVYEMMNLTAEQVFLDQIAGAMQIPLPTPDMLKAGVIIIDPAFGMTSLHDETAITVHAQIQDGYYGAGIPHVIDSIKGRITEEEMFDLCLNASIYWGISTWAIETNQGQRLFLPLFRLLLKSRGMNENVITFLGVSAGQQSKVARIEAFRTLVKTGHYGISENQSDMLYELERYTPEQSNDTKTKRDDLLDSASLSIIAWDTHGDIIKSKGIEKVSMSLFNSNADSNSLDEFETSPM